MSSNKSLYDMIVIHQILLEQLKNGFDSNFRKKIPQLSRDIKRLFSDLSVFSMSELTKQELNKFLKTLNKINTKFFDAYLKELQNYLRDFTSENRALSVLILGNYLDYDGDEVIEDEKESEKIIKSNKENDSEYPMTWLFGDNDEKLLEAILNKPMQSNGISANDELTKLKQVIGGGLIALVNKGWVSRDSKNTVLDSILGTAENNLKDGLLLKIERYNSSIVRTIQQSIAVEIEANLQALVFNKYKWISVMDYRTSEVCRYLNGRIFEYGKGPLPPKHNHCRSTITPLASGVPSQPETFNNWIARQSRQDQIAIVGKTKADALRDGKKVDFSKIDSAIKLKPSELRNKLALLTR